MKTMFLRSPWNTSPRRAWISFLTGVDSPVREASFTRRLAALEEPRVRRHTVARREHDDVARDDLACRHDGDGALAHDAGLRCRERLQGLERSFRAVLLDEAERGVQNHDDDD